MGAKSTSSHPTTTKADGHLIEYFRQNFGAGGGSPFIPTISAGLTATGGIINDYTVGSDVYRAHIFTSSGTFAVSAIGTFGNTVDYLVVGGGGAGGNAHGSNGTGGGGAGGLRTNMPACPYAQAAYPISTAAPYTVIVGGGGVCNTEPNYSRKGSHSEIYPTPGASGSGIYASGGGAGSSSDFTPDPEVNGGSGGGEDTYDSQSLIGSTVASPDSRSPTTQGFNGGTADPSTAIGGGGGGAGEAGNTDGQGFGGDGLQILIAEPPATPAPTRTVGADGGYFGGGGGGNDGPQPNASKPGGLGGGGGNSTPGGGRGAFNTGGGGGGAFSQTPGDKLGQGGSGIVVIRYKIATTLTAKAIGGVISFYNGKTIHTFVNSGTFATTSDWDNPAIEYVIVGGGGGGGGDVNPGAAGGGGGAGGYLTGPATVGTHPNTITVTVGAGGLAGPGSKPNSGPGNSSPGTDSGLDFSNGSQTDYYAAGGGRGGGGPSTPGTNYYGAHEGGSGGGGNGYTGNSANNGGAGNQYGPHSPRNPGPAPGQGNAGGTGPGGEPYNGGSGGGGAGGAGINAPASTGSNGGQGIQLPATFRDPTSSVGKTGHPGSDNFYVAGGGGGGTSSGTPKGGAGPASGGPYAGGGSGTNPDALSMRGADSTGGGGGGGGPNGNRPGGQGGSGIVLIAYPT